MWVVKLNSTRVCYIIFKAHNLDNCRNDLIIFCIFWECNPASIDLLVLLLSHQISPSLSLRNREACQNQSNWQGPPTTPRPPLNHPQLFSPQSSHSPPHHISLSLLRFAFLLYFPLLFSLCTALCFLLWANAPAAPECVSVCVPVLMWVPPPYRTHHFFQLPPPITTFNPLCVNSHA